jgi:Ca-activated chloride channel homolog
MVRSSRVISHRPRGRGRVATVSLLVVVMVAIGLVITFGGLTAVRRVVDACSGVPLTITVAVDPEYAQTFESLAQAWTATRPIVEGECYGATVESKSSADVASTLGPGWVPQRDGARPQAWIPESSLWLTVAGSRPDAATILPQQTTSVASSPVVMAVRQPLARAMGWPDHKPSWSDVIGAFADPKVWTAAGHPEWGMLRIGITDPASSTAGLAFVLSILDPSGSGHVDQQRFVAGLGLTRVIGALAPDTATFLAAQSPTAPSGPNSIVAAFPALERDVATFDADEPMADLVPVYDDHDPLVADYPYAILSGAWVTAADRAAAAAFGQYLLSTPAQAVLGLDGLRGPDDTVGTQNILSADRGFAVTIGTRRATPSAQALSQIVADWANLQRQVNLLALLDTSGSMIAPIPGTNLTRLGLLQETAATGFSLLPSTMSIGLWEFSVRPSDPGEYREVVPFGPLRGDVGSLPRPQALAEAIPRLHAEGFTPLYDTVYAAFHYMQQQWSPGSTNSVLLITDGYNELDGGLNLDDLIGKLVAEQQPDKPVQVVCIGMGSEADVAALTSIAQATGGKAFAAEDSASAIQTLILAFTGRLQ